MTSKSGSDGGRTWMMSWFNWDCFSDKGREASGSGIILGNEETLNFATALAAGALLTVF